MLKNGMILAGKTEDGREIGILPRMANRHGLIAGATGTGKTVTVKVLAESFSDLGVPVFLADVKGDLAGMIRPGADTGDLRARMERFGLSETEFVRRAYPVAFWDIYGKMGMPLRTTISEMGPLLLARILGLNDIQSQILAIAFRIADDGNLLLIDTKDLKAMLNYISENAQDYRADYGNISGASVAAIMRAVTRLEMDGGDRFFGEPALSITDWFALGADGRGMIHVLDSESLISSPALYATFLLWMLSELFETLPEVGDLDKPKMVFFFDEAHLLFHDASKELLQKIIQVVKLIRSKGVGIYFATQNPRDIPDDVLAQLGNRIEHGLRAYTPAEKKTVRAAAESFRENPSFDSYETILTLGTGEAVVSFLDEQGMPGISEKIAVFPPQSQIGPVDEQAREGVIRGSILYSKYASPVDPESAYELLQRKGALEAAEAERAAAEQAAEKQRKQEAAAAAKKEEKKKRDEEREEKKGQTAKKRAAKNIASSVTGTVGREVGKQMGKKFGSFGKTLGGNLGASLGRGILSTLFRL
ncbi:helicase HerA-like domain-containing protein [Lachnoclostridium sp. Marseille-P6806]|uniref:helicase HerA-like domain-containing protein n=1 Tax=Lachnoclostridium sp. Marseille-P6806 TaxID=2364793 RepID=UPI00102FCFD8|nr:helicase HerA-like domain-containing protein [Lachnoclostridium sp. Marseille-P6806]